jgi:hypothetical protein
MTAAVARVRARRRVDDYVQTELLSRVARTISRSQRFRETILLVRRRA